MVDGNNITATGLNKLLKLYLPKLKTLILCNKIFEFQLITKSVIQVYICSQNNIFHSYNT